MGGAPYTTTWTIPPSTTPISSAPSLTVNPLVTTTYKLVVSDNCGASIAAQNFTANVQVNTLGLTPNTATNVCGQVPTTLTASGGSSYTWSPATGLSATTGASVIATPAPNTYSTVAVTGFNNDIVANGVGTNTIEGTTYPAIGMDGQLYAFLDATYKYTSANALPTCYMPTNNSAASAITSGLTYTFQSYTANNALSIRTTSTNGYTNAIPTTGTLTLSSPAKYTNLYVLYETVVYTSPSAINALVTFDDASTQLISNNTVVNWFTATAPAFSGMGRTTPAGVVQCGTTPNMFELNLAILPTNQGKNVF